MKLLLSCLVAALAGAAGAAVEAPRLAIEGSPAPRGGKTLIVTLDFPVGWQGAVDLRVPPGYTGEARPARFGTAMSHLTLEGVRPDGSIAQRSGGDVTIENPEEFAVAAAQCAPGRHDAVWLLTGDLDDEHFTTPIFVDAGADGFRLRLCPELHLGALRVTSVVFATKAFTNPREPGTYVWRAAFAGLSEAQAIVRLPALVRLLFAQRKGRDVVVRGRATENGSPVAGAVVNLYGKARTDHAEPLGIARSDANGRFTVRRASRTFSIYGLARIPARLARECIAPALPCTATLGATYGPKTNAVAVR